MNTKRLKWNARRCCEAFSVFPDEIQNKHRHKQIDSLVGIALDGFKFGNGRSVCLFCLLLSVNSHWLSFHSTQSSIWKTFNKLSRYRSDSNIHYTIVCNQKKDMIVVLVWWRIVVLIKNDYSMLIKRKILVCKNAFHWGSTFAAKWYFKHKLLCFKG